MQRLTHELSDYLTYHTPEHTHDVVVAVQRLAAGCNVTGTALELLVTAAYFHDLGFVIKRVDHESHSIAIAQSMLPTFGYEATQVQLISSMIAATKLPQSPTNQWAMLLADADLDVLGREDYLQRNALLRAELATYGQTMTDRAWFTQQFHFLQTHQYWTDCARALRDAGKAHNIEMMRTLLNHLPAAQS